MPSLAGDASCCLNGLGSFDRSLEDGFVFDRFTSMGSEENKDLLKGVDWKTVGSRQPTARKRRIRQIPDYYFLPRSSIPSAIQLYGSIIAAGVGAGMLVEVWINKKIKEDGGIVWEMDKHK